jgi:ribosomal protein S18 acetylase RimI-like enzyme
VVRYNARMRTRPLDPTDLDAALALWERTEHLAPVSRDEVVELLRHDPGLVLVAEADDGTLLGAVLGGFDGRRGWISRLAVAPEHRRSGIASALVDELEARLRARGCRQVNLMLMDGNVTGRRFWTGRGYAITDEVALVHRRLDGDGPGGC